MLYEDILRGCGLYHDIATAYDAAYARFFESKCQSKWDCPEQLDEVEIKKLERFLNSFDAFHGRDYYVNLCGDSFTPILQRVLQILADLQDLTILGDFTGHRHSIKEAFDAFREFQCPLCQGGRHPTAYSKILHAINPNLFIMWDSYIRSGYGFGGTGCAYAYHFLPKMKTRADRAIRQVIERKGLSCEHAIQSFADCCRYNSLAKVLDEHNFMKYTKNHPKLAD